jgi:hypothetical protein
VFGSRERMTREVEGKDRKHREVPCTWQLEKKMGREKVEAQGRSPRPKRNEIWAVYLKRGDDRFEIQMPMLVSWKGKRGAAKFKQKVK